MLSNQYIVPGRGREGNTTAQGWMGTDWSVRGEQPYHAALVLYILFIFCPIKTVFISTTRFLLPPRPLFSPPIPLQVGEG